MLAIERMLPEFRTTPPGIWLEVAERRYRHFLFPLKTPESEYEAGTGFMKLLDSMCETQPQNALVAMSFLADDLDDKVASAPVKNIIGNIRVDCLLLGLLSFSYDRTKRAGRLDGAGMRFADPMFSHEVFSQRPIVVQCTEVATEFLRDKQLIPIKRPWWAFWKSL